MLAAIPETSWSRPSSFVTTGVHHGYRRVELVTAGSQHPLAGTFHPVLERFAPVWAAWLSWIDPGGFILPHRDAGPHRERWQVPIYAAGRFHADEVLTPADGVAFPVQHWRRHSVVNDTDRPRIHLVVDRDVIAQPGRAPFEVFPVPDDMASLVGRSLDGTTP